MNEWFPMFGYIFLFSKIWPVFENNYWWCYFENSTWNGKKLIDVEWFWHETFKFCTYLVCQTLKTKKFSEKKKSVNNLKSNKWVVVSDVNDEDLIFIASILSSNVNTEDLCLSLKNNTQNKKT